VIDRGCNAAEDSPEDDRQHPEVHAAEGDNVRGTGPPNRGDHFGVHFGAVSKQQCRDKGAGLRRKACQPTAQNVPGAATQEGHP
jgi:hypothetical protein